MAEGHATIHAPRSLLLPVARIEGLFNFAEVIDTVVYRSVSGFLPGYAEECFRISHNIVMKILLIG